MNNFADAPRQTPRADLRSLLELVEAASPVEAVDVLARELGRILDAHNVSFLITDFSGDALIRFVSAPRDNGYRIVGNDDEMERIALSGSPHAEALISQRVQTRVESGTTYVYAPVTDRGDAIGILELTLSQSPDSETTAFLASAAHALAYVIIASSRHTDMFERGQRNAPFSLAAEIQRRLLPASFTCEGAEFTLAGWLEPASQVGGDTFDYNVERNTLRFSVSDAMGHTVEAAQLATLAVGSLRNSRRAGLSTGQSAARANTAISENANDEQYVSAVLMEIDLESGAASAVNAGHPNGYLCRNGIVTELAVAADTPFGMLPTATYQVHDFVLVPGDRILLLTDGMLERNASSLDAPSALAEMAELHPREVVHRFSQATLAATSGELKDDATVLCVDWYGRQPGDGSRIATAGASQTRTSQITLD